MSEHRILFKPGINTILRSILPAIKEVVKYNIPIDIFIPNHDLFPGFGWMHDETALFLEDKGFTVIREIPKNKKYDIMYSAYPGFHKDIIDRNEVKYFVRFKYGVGGANVPPRSYSQNTHNFYDYILCLGKPDADILSGHCKTITIGNIKLADYKRTRVTPRGKKTLLYFPTWGAKNTRTTDRTNSINESTIKKLIELKNKYNIIAKMHQLSYHYEDQKEQRELFNQLDNVLDVNTPTDELMNQADVVLSDLTGGAFDAIAADVPLALFGLGEPVLYSGKLCLHQQLVKDDIIPGTNNIDELESIIEKALSPEYIKKQQKLKKDMFPYEGRDCVDAFIRFQDDLLNDRVDPWYIATRRAIRENYINERDTSAKEKSTLIKERDTLLQEKIALTQERDSLKHEFDIIIHDKMLLMQKQESLKPVFNPLVSIVIPVYNGSNYLREAIDSALAQTYKNIEIIVVNDGSTDNTEDICLSYGDKIRYIYKKNGKVASALNKGIENMKGEYFSWLSHDDMYMPDKIEKQIEALSSLDDKTRLITCGFTVVNEHGEKLHDDNSINFSDEQLEIPLFALLRAHAIFGCSWLIHKYHFERVGIFKSDHLINDHDLWFRMMRGQPLIYLRSKLAIKRKHTTQDSKSIYDFHPTLSQFFYNICDSLSNEEIEILFGSRLSLYKHQRNTLFRHCPEIMAKTDNKITEEILKQVLNAKTLDEKKQILQSFTTITQSQHEEILSLVILNTEQKYKNIIKDNTIMYETAINTVVNKIKNKYENSTSWKLTKPLRKIKKIFKRK